MTQELSAKEIINLHKTPAKSFHIPHSTKGIVPQNTEEEIINTKDSLNYIKQVLLSAERVERRNNRAEAIWLPDKHLAKVTRRVGSIFSQYGYEEDGQIMLFPEEALFLLQMNQLELIWNGVPFSVEQAYTVLLNSKGSLYKYRSFQELAINGYRLKRPEVLIKKRKHLKNDDCESAAVKKIKFDNNEKISKVETNNVNNKKDNNCGEYLEIFNRLKSEGPSTANIETNRLPLYHLYSPGGSIKDREPNHDVVMASGSQLSLQSVSENDSSVLTSFAGSESVSFYEFHKVNLNNT
ncbi:tRNA splicing endonuclease subunit 54 [Carabus blaptoides fortunei]